MAKNEPGTEKSFKKMNLVDSIVMGVGSIIGAGIFAVAPIGIRMVGNSIVIAFICAAVFVFLRTIPEIIISSSLPASGGAYMQLSRLLHPSLAVFQAFNQLVLGTMKVATLSLTFSEYFVMLFPALKDNFVYTAIVAVIIALVFTIISLLGVKTSAIVQNISVAVLLIAMFLFVVMGWGNVNIGFADIAAVNVKVVQIWAVMGMLHGSLIGANVLMYAADEVEDPRRTIPIAFTISTVFCALVYILMTFVCVGVQQAPADFKTPYNFATVSATFMGNGMQAFFITGGALLAVVTSINAVILMFSRSHFAAARDGLFPSAIAKVNSHGVPGGAIWLNTIIAVVAIISGFNLDDVVKITTFPGLLLSPLLFIAIFVLPKKFPYAYKNCFIRFPHWLNCTLVVVASVTCIALGWSVLMTMSVRSWVATLLFYVAAAIYTIIRMKWLKANKNIDLFQKMREPHQPWLDLEERLKQKELGEPVKK